MPWRCARSKNAASNEAGYSAPDGLFGVTSTIARVVGPIMAAASSGSGSMPAPQDSGRVVIPCMSSHIL